MTAEQGDGVRSLYEVTPFYFDSDDSQLWGVLHDPRDWKPEAGGVVLCPPYGSEYIRTHRFYVQLAGLLAEVGIPTLRFDLFGCGDSSGRTIDASVRNWVENVHSAVIELQHRRPCDRVVLAGVRFGGTLAALAARELDDLRGLVLWAPIVRGNEHLDELRREHRDWLRGSLIKAALAPLDEVEELLGFPLASSLKAEIEEINLLSVTVCPAAGTLLISDDSSQHRDLERHLRAQGTHLELFPWFDAPIWKKRGGDGPLDSTRAVGIMRRCVARIERWFA